MGMTRHIEKRMNERCISGPMLEIVQSFGIHSPNGERIILNSKGLQSLEKWTRDFLKQLEMMKRKGGLTLVEVEVEVEVEGDLLTVFANNSYRKNAKGS